MMCGVDQPAVEVHSIESIWSAGGVSGVYVYVCIYGGIYMGGLSGLWDMGCSGVQDKPEKVRPNTSSSGFSIVFGVCVLVTTNLLASSSDTRGTGVL